ncbi:MAG: leucine-rich repeat domain-containing protein [Fluviicola sp.]|nr:leucine-rich repeat domain-containing protein [Fluviicola sp.]
MNRLLFLSFLFSAAVVQAQCTDCTSLEEALKDPLRVQSLTLSNQGLLVFPAEIEQFRNLRSLDLSENSIADFTLEKPLHDLEQLNLSGNIPEPQTIAQLAKSYPKLTELDLSNCHLATIPPESFYFPKLRSLDLSSNGLLYLPEDLETLKELRELNLNDNDIKETYTTLGSLWKLNSLHIARNPRLNHAGLFNSLKASKNLNELEITYELWKSGVDRELAELPLKSVVIDGVDGKLPRGISSNPNIRNLSISNATNTDQVADGLKEMKQLTQLTLDNSPVPTNLEKADQLRQLSLKNTQTANVSAISKWKFLKELNVTESAMEAAVLEQLSTILPNTVVVSSSQEPVPEMITNQLEAISDLAYVTTSVQADQPTIVTVKEVEFNIPQNAFLREDGTLYNGPVNFTVKVYNDAVSMALEGAPMAYNDNGRQEIFSSDGMIDLKATTIDGEPLKANPTQPITVNMPDLQPTQDSKLYAFDKSTNNWVEIETGARTLNQDSIVDNLMDSLNSIDLKNFVNLQSVDRLFAIDFSKKRWDASEIHLRTYLPSKTVMVDKRDLCITRKLNVGKVVSKQSWFIDTVMTPQLKSLLHSIDSSYSLSKSTINSEHFHFKTEPRVITNVQIQPDFARDHYRLTFNYRDTLINLPVYLNGTSHSRTLQKHKQFQQQLERAQKADKKEEQRLERRKKVVVNNYIDQNRSELLALAFSGAQGTSAVQERLRFPLPNFGLFNCDRFLRAPKNENFALNAKLIDQNQVRYNRPDIVRVAFPSNFSYISTSSTSVPVFVNDKSIVLIDLPDAKLGVMIVGSEKEANASVIHTIDKSGKSAEELRQFIFNIQ